MSDVARCPRCSRWGILAATVDGPRCGTCARAGADDPHAPEMHGPRRYQRRGPSPATVAAYAAAGYHVMPRPAPAATGYHVVRRAHHDRTLDGFPVNGPCVTTGPLPGDVVLDGPFPTLADAQAALLVRVGAHPDTTTARAWLDTKAAGGR